MKVPKMQYLIFSLEWMIIENKTKNQKLLMDGKSTASLKGFYNE